MSINLTTPEAQIRENRLSSITGYKGSIKDLASQAGECSLKNGERGFTQTTSCSLGCAQNQLLMIKDAAVVGHSSIGCGSDTIQANINSHRGQFSRNWEYTNINYINSNMTEEATVFGGTAKLREAIREAYRRFNPEVIFVTTSCVSGIIGENISGILEGLTKEIPVPLVPVHCEGFRSKLWASGFDAAFHAILSYIVKPAETKNSNLINIINFAGTGRKQVIRLFNRLGLVPQFIIQFTTVEQLTKLSEAAATLTFCGTLGSYLASGLEEHFGVPYIKSLQPHGIAGTDSWLRELGEKLGIEEKVEKLIAEEKAAIAPELAELKERLKGKRVVIGMGPSFSQNFTRLLQELDLEVVWTTSWHFDQRHDYGEVPATVLDLASNEKDIPACVSELQVHEITNLLRQINPDVFICRHGGMAIWSAKLGIPTIFVNNEYQAFGYQGLINFGNRVADALANPTFVKYLASKIKLPYTSWWLEQDAFKFLREAPQKKQKHTKAVG
jgi:nitrogenase molybdenum-iron protein alpha chain